MARSAIMNVMIQAATKAGRSLTRAYGEVENLQASLKGSRDYVLKAKQNAANMVMGDLLKARSQYGFLSSDTNEIIGDDRQHRFIVNPLSGLENFSHAIPFFACSIALERQGQIVASLIYNPIWDELFTAEKGNGAFLNDRRIRTANRRHLEECTIGCAIPYSGHGHHGKYLIELRNIMERAAGVRSLGSTVLDLAYVASGRLDGFWQSSLSICDMAAPILLIKEGGGFLSDLNGSNNMMNKKNIVAGNEIIHQQLLSALNKAL